MKLSQEKLAELLDVDYKTINFIENHKGNPTFEIVYQLIRVLKLDAREIFNYDLKLPIPKYPRSPKGILIAGKGKRINKQVIRENADKQQVNDHRIAEQRHSIDRWREQNVPGRFEA